MAAGLRTSYDIGTTVSEDPIIVVVEDFLSADECAHLIEGPAPRCGEVG